MGVSFAPGGPRQNAVSDILRARAESSPRREALVFLQDGELDAVHLTYAELDRRARAHARLLDDVRPAGDGHGPARVLVLHPPGIDFIAAFFGVLYAGLVPVPAYVPRNTRAMPRLAGIVEDSGASIVTTTARTFEAIAKVGAPFAGLRPVLPPAEEQLSSLAAAWRERDADIEACALLQYTSGSTSRPKGVVLRHRQLIANTTAIAAAFGTREDSVGLIWLPPYHDMGLIGGILQPIAAGFPVVLMSPMAFLQRPARWLEAIARHHATISGGPNFAYDLLTRKIAVEQRESLDLSSWTTAFCGAEPIRAATLARFAETFAPSRFRARAFVPCYGLAEATLLVTGARRSEPPRVDEGLTRVVGCGPPAEATRVAIVEGSTGTHCPEGVEGEIWVTGPGVADGYFRAPDATHATFDAQLVGDAARYLRTGDLGYLRDGELFVTGRTKELIIVRGRKFHPRDIEEAAQGADRSLRAHGGAAFSSRGRVVLVQELERGARPELANVAEAIRQSVGGALDLALDAVLLVRTGTVPLTSSGKIQRAACRAAYEDGSIEVLYDSGADSPDGTTSIRAMPLAHVAAAPAARVAAILRVDGARLAPDVALTALGLDSLAAVEVQSFVRAAGADVTVDELLSGITWGTLERRVEHALTSPRAAAPLPDPAPAEEIASFVETAAIAQAHARPDSSALNVAVAGWVEDVDLRALERALAALVVRHDALRTSFVADGDAIQRNVAATLAPSIEVVAAGADSVEGTLAERAWTPFDVSHAPLFRVVIANAGDRTALLFAAHHAIVDLASLEVLLRDLGELHASELGGRSALYPPTFQASDAARVERAFVAHEAEAFARRWEERLPHPLPVLDLPRIAARKRAPLRPAGLLRFALPESARADLRDLARATSSSTFTVLLATYHLVLHHWSGQPDIVVGCETAGRTRAELGDVVASIARPLPIHASVDRSRTFAETTSALRGAVLGALEDQAYPFLAIVDRLVKKGASFEPDAPPVFQAVFNFVRDRGQGGLAAVALGRSDATISAGPLRLRTIGLAPRHAHSEIALLADGDSLDLALLYDADLFDASAMVSFGADLVALLERAVSAPDTAVDALLAALPRRRVPVRVAANFTATPIEPSLAHWLKLAALPPSIEHLPYDGLLRALHDGSLRGDGANVLVVRVESLARGSVGREAVLTRNTGALLDALAAFGASTPPPTVLAVTPLDDASSAPARAQLLAWAREQPWLTTIDLGDVAARFEVHDPFDRHTLELGDAPLSEEMAAAAGAAIARALRCALVPAKKVIVVDADGTLWGGVAAEDGPYGVRVDGPYAELQRRLVALHEAGMLVAVVTKNVEADVDAVFETRREMPLSREHLVALRASWTPKPEVVRALASELDLGLDSFVFVDDSPVECGAMRVACPEILVVELPDRPDAIPRRLDAVWELDRPRTTDEDRKRARMYREEAGRTAARGRAASLGDFLASLELVVHIAPLTPADVPRASQLTQRTNQLNTTTRRMTEHDVAAQPDTWTVRVRDRFGDYGLVGLLILEARATDLLVPALLLSCRALGRGVEGRLLAWIGERARERGKERIVFSYARTARNEPARRMLEAFGGAPLRVDAAEVVVPTRDVEDAAARSMPAEEAPATSETSTPARSTGGRLLEATIACDRASAIVAALAGARRRRRGAPVRELVGNEALVGAAWSEVLGVDSIDPDDDFFALGGTSLQAIAVASKLRRSLGVALDGAVLFERPRLADLARALAPALPTSVDELDASVPVPATAMQRRLWLLDRVDPTDTAYHVPFGARIRGELDLRAWELAWKALVARHEALRLRFVPRDDEPFLAAGSGAGMDLEVERVRPEAIDAWLAARIRRPFDLERGPLARAALARIEGRDEHVFLVVLHHAVADGASLVTLVGDLARSVRGEAFAGPAPSWLAYARTEAGRSREDEERALAAARVELAGIEPLEIPIDRPTVTPVTRGSVSVRVFPASRASELRAAARTLGTTPFTFVLAAFGALLGRLAGRDDVAVGIPVTGRGDPRWQDLVGPLVNTVVARVRLDGELDGRALVARAHDAAHAAYARAAVPFERLVAAIVPERDPARSPLVQALIVEQPSAAAIVPHGSFDPLALTSGGAQLDLSLAISHEPDGTLRLALEHRTDRVSTPGAEAFLERLAGMLAAMIDEPTRRIASIALVTAEERARILAGWAGPDRPYVLDEGLARGFERQVDRSPDAAAVTDDAGTLTYAELDRAANRLAHALLARGVRRGDRVGIALSRSRALVAAVHACLKLGAPYVPLEPDLPLARRRLMADDARVVVVFCDAGAEAELDRSIVATSILDGPKLPSTRPHADVRGTDLAYVLYTSGSTGRPKGVMVEHAGVQNRLAYQEEVIALAPGEPVLHKTPYGFDVSVWELLWPLRVGGHLVVAPPGAHRDPDALVRLVERHAITTLHFVPSMLGAFVEADGLERLGSLRRVFASGEALPRDTVERLRARLPRVEVHNFYGPTEASIEVTHLAIPPGPVGPMSIGRPIPNTRIYVVDDRGALLPPGAVGELWISGVQVARGYLGDDERTRAAFLDDPFVPGARVYRTGDLARFRDDGTIEFLGRKDRQVKIRGNRIELGEIETALRTQPLVEAALVVAREGRLVAYVVGTASDEALRAHLAGTLPGAMLPGAFVRLPELPIGPTGKIAHDRLPEPPRATSSGASPATPAERTLAEIWSSVLDVRDLDRDADFFALGGDSILALKIVSRARARGLALVPRDVFERPTLRGLAARATSTAQAPAVPRVEPGERAPLLPMQARFFASHGPAVRDRFCQSVHLVALEPIDPARLARAFDLVAEAHPALATRFEHEGDRVVAQARPSRPSGVAHVARIVPGEDAHAIAAESVRIDGPLVAAAVEGREAVLVIHHVVVDAVSWRVLLGDLGSAYAALTRGETPTLGDADGTFTWARAIDAWTNGERGRAERDVWTARLAALRPEAFTCGLDRGSGRAAETDAITVRLDRATTSRLFAVLRATFAEVDEAIAGALSVAFMPLSVIEIERHGRDTPLGAALDLPRALGWLTALFPVVLAPRAHDPRSVLEAAHEAFAGAPSGFTSLPRAEVVVNYVGAVTGEDAAFRITDASSPLDRHPDGPRDHVLEVVARLDAGELALAFHHPRSEANAHRVARAAARVVEELNRLAGELDRVPADHEDVHPLAPVQRGMLVDAARSPSAQGVYVEQLAVDVDGPVEVARLRRAWEVVVARHPALRSELVGSHAVVLSPAEIFARGIFETEELAPDAGALEAWLDADRARGFDPARAPLLRVTLLARGGTHTMVLTHHHAIADGWCVPLLLSEALAALRGDDLGPPPPPYRELVRWLDRQDRAAALAHFHERLQGLARATPPPRDRKMFAGPATSQPRRTLRHDLTPPAVRAMERLARDAGVTTSTVALAAYALTLARMTGEARVVFAVTVHGRPADLPGAERMVGLLIQTLPFVVEAVGDVDVRQWLVALQADLVRDQGHAHVGLAAIQAAEAAAACDDLFVVENYPLERPEDTCGLTFGPPRARRQVKSPFAFVVPPGPPAAEIDLDPSRVSEEDGRDFLDRWARLLETLAGAPAARVRQVGVVTEDERARALAMAHPPKATRVDLDARTLHRRFEDASLAKPGALAIDDGRLRVTYAELAGAAYALAEQLRAHGVAPGDLVGVVAEPGAAQIAGVLGVLFAGGAFVPFDPSWPAARLEAMHEAARPRVLVASKHSRPAAERLSATVVLVDTTARADRGTLPSRVARDRAYVLFTSGSTGRPKGVVCHHAGVDALIDDLDARAPIGDDAHASLWTSPSFDVSLWEIFATLTRGAALHVVPADVRADARALVAWMDEHQIASAYVPGFALEALAERVESGGCRDLRRVLIGVEPIPSALVARIITAAPALVVVNGYGPTETSICATLHTVTTRPDTAIVPIGRAAKGARVYLLDDRTEPVPPRVPGEIVVAGAGVAHGYLDGDAERFVPDPFAPPPARMYRTGDRAIALDDGTLVFLGRRDQQVKVRGVRIELGEVEAALARLPFVREGAALTLESPGGASLAAVVALQGDADGPRTRAELRALLPDAMVPARIVVVDALPRDPINGKIDRTALRALVPGEDARAPEAGLTPTTEIVVGIVGALLGAPPRAEDDFLGAGGDSLSATRLAVRIEEAFGVRLPLSTVFQARNLTELAAAIDAARRSEVSAPPLVASGEEAGPASFAQERLLFIDRLDPGSPVYNLACAARLTGPLDLEALRRALAECVRRHGALRTVFGEEDGRPVQRLVPSVAVLADEDVIDLRGETDPLAHALQQASEAARRPFDLAAGPLLRAQLHVLAADDHVITLGLHHVVADGWSLGLVLDEVLALYDAFQRGAPSPLAPLPIQYLDFARWQRASLDDDRTRALVRFWGERLAGAPPLLELPTDHPRPAVQSFRGGHVRFTIDAETASRIDALARRSGATSAMVLLAALDAVLVRWSGTNDVSVGVSLANRRRREVEPLVGFFVNLVVVRAELSDANLSFDALLRHVRERSLEAYDHQDLPFDRLVEELRPRRTLAHAPLFQVNFVYDDAPRVERARGLEVSPLDVETGTSRFDLALSLLRDRGRIVGSLEYNGDVFERTTAERLVTGFERLLAAAVDEPQRAIDSLPLGAPARLEHRPAASGTFLEAFADAVRGNPGATALVSADANVTYAELDRRSAHLANVLRSAGVGRDVIVGVCASRSIEAVVAILGVLRAGGAWLPLDPAVPLARLGAIVEDATPALVVTTAAAADLVPASVAQVIVLDELDVTPGPITPPPLTSSEDDLAYVIYTSGSTGTPNGVAVTRRGLSNLARSQARAFGIDPSSRVLQFASLAFDASVSEIATTLASGATLDLGAGVDRDDVAADLRRVTLATLPPSLLAALDPADYPDLRTVVSAGEPLPAAVARRWLDANKRLLNAYGPTETTVCATLGEVTLDDVAGDRVPTIGRPLDGASVHVLDARHAAVPPGVVGEIAIGGACLARGYLRRDELTAARFVEVGGERLFLTGDRARLRDDGRLEFLGRRDEQLKVRGHRIEAGDVEACLRRHSSVADAAVVLAGERRLVAFVVAVEAGPATEELTRFVAGRLPSYMVPDRIVVVDALPLTTSGKVDRRALAARDATPAVTMPTARVAPRTRIEGVLTRAFAEVLHVPEIGIHDNFFELGGDSIASIQVAARARREGVAFVVKDLFLKQTVADLATGATEIAPQEIVDVPAEGEVPLTPIQRWFLEQGTPDPAHYNQSVMLEIDATLDLGKLREAARRVAHQHDALRLRFEGTTQRYVDDAEGSIVVEGASFAELAAVRARAQRGLDLARGPVVRVVLFEGRPARLLVVAHHLVMDAVSLRILVTDLLAPGSLPPKTASYKAWSHALATLDVSAERQVLATLERGRVRLPGGAGGNGRRGDARTVTTELDVSDLEKNPLGATIEQALLVALGLALAPVLRGGAIVVDVEGHGRDPLDADRPLDVTRTVGWFTSVSPVRIDTASARDVRTMLREVKDALAAIPRAGAGFGVLGYLGSGEIGLNYLGRVDRALAEGVRLAPEQATDDQSPTTLRPAAIELQAMIVDGRLRVVWTYVDARHARSTIEAWAAALLDALRAIAQPTTAAPVHSAADFPDAGLTAAELADVLDEIEGA